MLSTIHDDQSNSELEEGHPLHPTNTVPCGVVHPDCMDVILPFDDAFAVEDVLLPEPDVVCMRIRYVEMTPNLMARFNAVNVVTASKCSAKATGSSLFSVGMVQCAHTASTLLTTVPHLCNIVLTSPVVLMFPTVWNRLMLPYLSTLAPPVDTNKLLGRFFSHWLMPDFVSRALDEVTYLTDMLPSLNFLRGCKMSIGEAVVCRTRPSEDFYKDGVVMFRDIVLTGVGTTTETTAASTTVAQRASLLVLMCFARAVARYNGLLGKKPLSF